MIALFRKELRDVVRWAPIGIVLIAVLGWMSVPSSVHQAFSTASSLLWLVGSGSGLIALALGLLQSLPELRNDARGYLVHRPTTMATIFWAKILAGFCAYMACIVPTLLVVGVYLESIGPQRLPVSWMDVIPVSVMSLVIFLIHPAAIWTTSREAKWVGTRWFPLALASGGILLVFSPLSNMSPVGSLISAASVSGVIGFVVCTAAQHAFTHQQFSPSMSAKNRMSKSRSVGLFAASVLVVIVPSTLAAGYLSKQLFPYSDDYHRISMDTDGRLWEISERTSRDRSLLSADVYLTGRPISGPAVQDEDAETRSLARLPDDWKERVTVGLPLSRRLGRLLRGQFTYIGSIGAGDVNPQFYTVACRQGQLFLYRKTRLIGYITPMGIYPATGSPEGRFDEPMIVGATWSTDQRLNVTGQPLVADSGGVYQLDVANASVRQIVSADLRTAEMTLPSTGQEAVLWVASGDALERHALHAANSDESLPLTGSDVVAKTNRYPLPAINSELTGRFTSPDWNGSARRSAAENADGVTALIDRTTHGTARFTIYSANGSVSEEATVRLAQAPNHSEDGIAVVVPPSLIAGMFLWSDTGGGLFPVPIWWAVGAHTLLAVFLVQWLSSSLGLSLGKRVMWSVIAAATGIATSVAMLAIYPRLVREPCGRCESPRRIDKNRCEHCGAEWDPPQAEGIEIISDAGVERSPVLT